MRSFRVSLWLVVCLSLATPVLAQPAPAALVPSARELLRDLVAIRTAEPEAAHFGYALARIVSRP